MTIEELVNLDDAKIQELLAKTDAELDELFKEFKPMCNLIREMPAEKTPRKVMKSKLDKMDPEKAARIQKIMDGL